MRLYNTWVYHKVAIFFTDLSLIFNPEDIEFKYITNNTWVGAVFFRKKTANFFRRHGNGQKIQRI